MSHVLDRLVERAFGELSQTDTAEVDAHLARCARCLAEADAIGESLSQLALALPPIAPAPHLKARILAAAAGTGRLSRFNGQLAAFFDVTVERAKALLDVVDEPAAWEPGPLPGVQLLHFFAGPRVATADCGLVRFPAGLVFPEHRHIGHESMLVFEGGLIDSDGRRVLPGEQLDMTPGSVHAFTVLPEQGCVCAVIVHQGIEMPPGNRLIVE